jgi:hypothetical protein
MGRGFLVLGAVAGAALFISGCAGKSADPAPATWSTVERVMQAQVGSYSQVTTVVLDGERRILLTEWVSYDLRRPFIERNIGLGDNPNTPEVEEPPPKSAPSLRFLYGADRVVMWNPNAFVKCNTSWVEMPEKLLARVTGIHFDDLLEVGPRAILEQSIGKPTLVEGGDEATAYDITIPATASFPPFALASRPELAGALQGKTVKARVRIPRDQSPIQIVVDLGAAFESVLGSGAADRSLSISWLVSRTPPPVDSTFPMEAAPASCLDN